MEFLGLSLEWNKLLKIFLLLPPKWNKKST
nr:MAG TPA: hypothetical protein [Caudoviricetes sp.]DAO53552.1 MAG TPA: hypothetical protein [Caudoviricetes sp.]